MDNLWVTIAGALGLLIGSFLNVVILRLPADASVVAPASHCPSCGKDLHWYHNIPVLSWVALRGRCGFCGMPISIQYPLVELATGVIWAGSVALYGLAPEAAISIMFLTILLGIAVTDARTYIIPDELSLGGAGAGVVLALLPGGLTVVESLIGLAIGGGALWLVAEAGTWMFKKEAMGGGDIKMMAMVGAFLGWKGALLTVFLGSLAGTLIFIPIALARPNKLVPFGVFLAIGAALALEVGPPLLAWYGGFF